MKLSLVFLSTLVVSSVGILSGATVVSCGTVTSSVQPCTNGDKIFDNFSFTGNVPANGSIQVTEALPGRVYVIDLSGFFTTNFIWAYDVTSTGSPITHIGYGITGLPNQFPTLQTTAGPVVGPATSGNVFETIPPSQTLRVVNSFSSNGGFATRISNTIVQSPVSEAPPFGLIPLGAALIGFTRKVKGKENKCPTKVK